MSGQRQGSRLHGMGMLDQDLLDALDEEQDRIQQRGTGHSYAAVAMMQHGNSPEPSAAQPSLPSLEELFSSQLQHSSPSTRPQRLATAKPAHAQPAATGNNCPTSVPDSHSVGSSQTLRSSAVGRLLDAMVVPPSNDEAIARAVCDRLVDFVSYQWALSENPGLLEELEGYQVSLYQEAYRALAPASTQSTATATCSNGSGRGQDSPACASGQRHQQRLLPPLAQRRGPSAAPTPAVSYPTSSSASGLPPLGSDTLHTPLLSVAPSNSQNWSHPNTSHRQQGNTVRPWSGQPSPSTSAVILPRLSRQISCPGELPGRNSNTTADRNPVALSPAQPAGQPLPSHRSWPMQQHQSLASVQEDMKQEQGQQEQGLQEQLTSGTSQSRRPPCAPAPSTCHQSGNRGATISQASSIPRVRSAGRRQFASLTAYMMHMLAADSRRAPRFSTAQDWGSQNSRSGGVGGSRRERANSFSPHLQEHLNQLARLQLDTIRAEARSQLKKVAGSGSPADAVLVR